MKSGLGGKFQNGHRISLTTLYLVYILSDNTKYGFFVIRGSLLKRKIKRRGEAKIIWQFKDIAS